MDLRLLIIAHGGRYMLSEARSTVKNVGASVSNAVEGGLPMVW